MPTNIKVCVRVRPLLPQEIRAGLQRTLLEMLPGKKEINIRLEGTSRRCYRFDRILDEQVTQEQLFKQLQVATLVNKVVEGFHATILAYGQTGSGKSYTMEGYQYAMGTDRIIRPMLNAETQAHGISLRCISEIFRQVASAHKRTRNHYKVYCSFLEIYNEKVFDLLNIETLRENDGFGSQANNQGLRLRWTKRDQFKVENLYIYEIQSDEECIDLYNFGIHNKVLASHNLNMASSRSHTMFTITIESTDANNIENVITSKLQLVDLAGSERVSQTGNAAGKHFKESVDINKSLFILRKVITNLSEQKRNSQTAYASTGKKENAQLPPPIFIPYRESKLTSLLKQSLGGNSFCLMVACLSPSDFFCEENISTLNYASKASIISNEPVRNEDPKIMLINDLKRKNQHLVKELKKANELVAFLTQFAKQKGGATAIPHKYEYEPLKEDSYDAKTQISPSKNIRLPSIDEGTSFKEPVKNETKVLDSVIVVKELLQSNNALREQLEHHTKKMEQEEIEIFNIQHENQDLKDKIELLEGLFGKSTINGSITDNMGSNNPAHHKSAAGDSLYRELLQEKQEKKRLEQRIKHLELQNLQMAKDMNYVGNSEPSRPLFGKETGGPQLIPSHSNNSLLLSTAASTKPSQGVLNSRRSKSVKRIHSHQQTREGDNINKEKSFSHIAPSNNKIKTEKANPFSNSFMTSTMKDFSNYEDGEEEAVPSIAVNPVANRPPVYKKKMHHRIISDQPTPLNN